MTAPGQGPDSSRASFSISASCIHGTASSSAGLCLFARTRPLPTLPAVFIPQGFLSLLRAAELSFGGRSVGSEPVEVTESFDSSFGQRCGGLGCERPYVLLAFCQFKENYLPFPSEQIQLCKLRRCT